MDNVNKNRALFWLGIAVAGAGLFDLAANLGDWYEVFWFCPLTSAVLSLALICRSALLVTMCLVAAVPAQSMWILDFILQSSGHGMGRTAQLMACGPVILTASVLTHTLLIPAALIGVRRLGFHSRALAPVLVYGGWISFLTFNFTPVEKNVNCAFYPCDAADPGQGYGGYFVMHFLLAWTGIAVVSFIIGRYVFRRRLVL
jgi:hypothetical protein